MNDLDQVLSEMNEAQGAVSSNAHALIGDAAAVSEQPWTPELVITLSITVFVFGLIICALMTVLHAKGKGATDLLRLFSLPLIIVSAVVLVIAGYSDRQISSVIGLLGTMAGYLLGSRGSSPAPDDTPRGGSSAQATQLAELEIALAKARMEAAKTEQKPERA